MFWEIELQKFSRETMLGRKNEARRREAIVELLSEPISQELADFLRKVRLAALLEKREDFEGMRDLSDWEYEKRMLRHGIGGGD